MSNGKISFSFASTPGASSSTSTVRPPNGQQSNLALLMAKAKQPAKPAKPVLFDDDEETPRPAPTLSSKSIKTAPQPKLNTLDTTRSSAAISRSERKQHEEALKLDQTAFQYDEVYDNLKAAERIHEETKKAENAERKPKYIESFLQSARTRKLDRLHAEEKMMQLEREKEGDEFEEKEKFVTGAYKAQMEEVRKAEEEERKREEELRKSKKGPGLTAFYKSMLDDSEAKHAAAIASASGMTDSGPSLAIKPPTKDQYEPDAEAEYDPFLAREQKAAGAGAGSSKTLEETGKELEINDDGEVVDKRSLLKAGLNIMKKPKSTLPDSLKTGQKSNVQLDGSYQSRAVGAAASHAERMARERRRLDAQLRDEEERKRRDDEQKLRDEEEEARRRKEGADGEAEKRRKEAKERFLARKRAREEGGAKEEEDAKKSKEG